MTVLRFIIPGYMWQILGRGAFLSPPPIRDQPRKSLSWIELKVILFVQEMQEINENEQKLMESLTPKLSPNLDLLELEFPKKRKPDHGSVTYRSLLFLKKGNSHTPIGSVVILKWWISITAQKLVILKWKSHCFLLPALFCTN